MPSPTEFYDALHTKFESTMYLYRASWNDASLYCRVTYDRDRKQVSSCVFRPLSDCCQRSCELGSSVGGSLYARCSECLGPYKFQNREWNFGEPITFDADGFCSWLLSVGLESPYNGVFHEQYMVDWIEQFELEQN